jgi:hypothetical protein
VEREPDTDAVNTARTAVLDGTASIARGVFGESVFEGSVMVLSGAREEFRGRLDESRTLVEPESGAAKSSFSRAEVSLRRRK